MVHLDELYGSARRDLDNSILVMLQTGRTTRDVALELQVSHSHVARLRKKRLCDLPASSGGRPQVLSDAQKRACVRAITSGVFETAKQGMPCYCEC